MSSRETLVRTHDLWKSYSSAAGTLDVLRGIHVDIRAGEILAVMGRSGVGKSTLLNLLGLLDHPSQGTIEMRIDGRMVEMSTAARRERSRVRNRQLGFVFQFYHLLPDLDVLENVLLPVMISQTRREYRRQKAAHVARARELLARVQVERERHRPTMLSGGERQRVAIARALMNQPTLVLCDEPTGNLDTTTSAKIHELFTDINRSLGTTFLMVTHDERLAAHAHRTLHMVDGRFVDDGVTTATGRAAAPPPVPRT